MSTRSTDKALNRYVNTASDLAESLKRNIQKDRFIDDKTMLILNEFIIAANEISDMIEHLNKKVIKFNQ